MPQTFKGDVFFHLHEKRCPFRFEVSVTSEHKVVIWIENRESKKQWQTSPLELRDFVTSENAIPKATADEYAARFAACLDDDDQASSYRHSLSVDVKGGFRTLQLSVPLLWGSHKLTVDYKFSLTLVPLERVDILGARLRDVEDQIQVDRMTLQTELKKVNGSHQGGFDSVTERLQELECQIKNLMKPVFAYAVIDSTGSLQLANQTVPWEVVVCSDSDIIEFQPSGRIRLRMTGAYAVDINIVHTGASNGTVYFLKKGEYVIATCSGYSPNSYYTSSPMKAITFATADEELSVVHQASGYVYPTGSYITVTKL